MSGDRVCWYCRRTVCVWTCRRVWVEKMRQRRWLGLEDL